MTVPTFAEPLVAATRRRPRGPAAEFLRYFAASAVALALDTALYAGLLAAGTSWAIAAAAGFCLGLAVAYIASVRFVFAHRAVPDRRHEFALFAAIGLVGLLLTEALLWLFIERLRLGPLPAKLITAGAVFLTNFGLRKLLLFTRRETPP